LAERGIMVTYESIRRWVLTFGPVIARRLRARRPRPHSPWHLDEMAVCIRGKQMYLWRAVDAEGEVLDVLLQARRDTKAARKLMRKLLEKQGVAPDKWVTDKNPAYSAALRTLKLTSPLTLAASAPTTEQKVLQGELLLNENLRNIPATDLGASEDPMTATLPMVFLRVSEWSQPVPQSRVRPRVKYQMASAASTTTTMIHQ
jgi:transposase-like protein